MPRMDSTAATGPRSEAAGDVGALPSLAVGRRDAAAFAEATAALPALCRRFRVRRLDVFGSAATGDGFDPARSDLDLLVAFEDGLSAGEYADAFFGLRAALKERFGRPAPTCGGRWTRSGGRCSPFRAKRASRRAGRSGTAPPC
jgi:predicted nucleotidyltransferase